VTGQWFSPGTPVSSTNKTDHHDITEILLKDLKTKIKLKEDNNVYKNLQNLMKEQNNSFYSY
jgi:hypothetical protein